MAAVLRAAGDRFPDPYVEQALADRNATVEIGALSLRWEGFDRPAVLAARDVRVRQRDGTLIAFTPEGTADVSMPKLLRGVVAPLRIDLIRPHLRVTRTEAGEFSFGLGKGETGEGGASTPAEGRADPRRGQGPAGGARRPARQPRTARSPR